MGNWLERKQETELRDGDWIHSKGKLPTVAYLLRTMRKGRINISKSNSYVEIKVGVSNPGIKILNSKDIGYTVNWLERKQETELRD